MTVRPCTAPNRRAGATRPPCHGGSRDPATSERDRYFNSVQRVRELPLSMTGPAGSANDLAHSACARWSLHGANHVDEHALLVVAQIRQIFGEIREVVADAELHVLTDVAVTGDQRAAAALVDVRQGQETSLQHAFPVLSEAAVGASDANRSTHRAGLRASLANEANHTNTCSPSRTGDLIAKVAGCHRRSQGSILRRSRVPPVTRARPYRPVC